MCLPQISIRFPGTWVIDACELLGGCWKPNGSSWRASVLSYKAILRQPSPTPHTPHPPFFLQGLTNVALAGFGMYTRLASTS